MKRLFFLLITACIAACSSPAKSPKEVLERYVESINKGDYEAVIEMIYFDPANGDIEKSKARMLMAYEGFVGVENQKRGGISSYEVFEELVGESGLSGVVSYQLNYGNGKSDKLSSRFKNVDGKWYIMQGR